MTALSAVRITLYPLALSSGRPIDGFGAVQAGLADEKTRRDPTPEQQLDVNIPKRTGIMTEAGFSVYGERRRRKAVCYSLLSMRESIT